MPTITAKALHDFLVQGAKLAIIDVRTPIEYAEVHVAQARSLPLDTLNPRALVESGQLPNNKPIYILCRSGQRATKASEQFIKEGFSNTTVVEGGTLAWIEAGLPVERGQVRVISLERQVRIAAGTIVLSGVGLGWFVNPAFFGLSAFVGAGLIFAGITDWCGMGLLLAKAPWNQKV